MAFSFIQEWAGIQYYIVASVLLIKLELSFGMLRVCFVILKSFMFLDPSGDFNDYSLYLANASKCTKTNTTEFSKKK